MATKDCVIAAVSEFALSPVLETYCRRSGKSRDQAEIAATELKRFLSLCILYDEPLAMFAFADDIWHEFICHTRLYHKFCNEIAGRYIHHTPHCSASESQVSIARTRELYERHFGDWPSHLLSSADCESSGGGDECKACSSDGPSVLDARL